MQQTSSRALRRLFAVVAISFAASGAYAQSAADPHTVWDYSDGPAAWSLFPDAMAFGFRGEAGVSDLPRTPAVRCRRP